MSNNNTRAFSQYHESETRIFSSYGTDLASNHIDSLRHARTNKREICGMGMVIGSQYTKQNICLHYHSEMQMYKYTRLVSFLN